MMIKLGPLLVQGGWCQIYEVREDKELCAKVLVPKRRFKGARPNPDFIVKEKYGIDDFLEYEWRNYQKIISVCPEDLKQYFVSIIGVEMTTDGRKALIMKLVRDEEGLIANNLANYSKKINFTFINNLIRVQNEVFVANNIDHFGVHTRNILVKNANHPVFLDFQTGKERFRGQFWLNHPWFVQKKVNRCFDKVYDEIKKRNLVLDQSN